MNINEILKSDYDLLCKDYKKATKKIEKQDNEIERLNNIINEIEKFLKINSEKDDYDLTEYNKGVNNAYNYTLDKLKELKGSDKE